MEFVMRPGFDEWALGLAKAVSLRSRDPSTKVGAVIIRTDKTIASMGYNGFPKGMPDHPEWYNDREQKLARVIHAEMNAILNCKEDVKGFTLYSTHPCCENCAKHVIAAGIKRVVVCTDKHISARWNTEVSERLFEDSGVEFVKIELET